LLPFKEKKRGEKGKELNPTQATRGMKSSKISVLLVTWSGRKSSLSKQLRGGSFLKIK